MRQMFGLVFECSDEMVKRLINMMIGKNPIELEMKKTFEKYTSEVIATCAFAIKIDSFKNPDNEFLKAGKTFQEFNNLGLFRMECLRVFPFIAKYFDIQFFPRKF